jgi:hypothetical protein
MLIRTAVGATLLGIGLGLTSFSSAQALTSHECSVKYQEAQKANSLNGMKYADFRKAQCGSDAAAPAATPAAATAPAAPAANPLKPTPAVATPAPAAPKPAATAPAAATNAVFPKAIDPKYSTISAGKGRQKTCVDQYNANKASNGNGGMKWIEKGGGYWSACDKVLKGA